MDYLTANEMAQIWNISSRMVAYYARQEKLQGQ